MTVMSRVWASDRPVTFLLMLSSGFQPKGCAQLIGGAEEMAEWAGRRRALAKPWASGCNCQSHITTATTTARRSAKVS